MSASKNSKLLYDNFIMNFPTHSVCRLKSTIDWLIVFTNFCVFLINQSIDGEYRWSLTKRSTIKDGKFQSKCSNIFIDLSCTTLVRTNMHTRTYNTPAFYHYIADCGVAGYSRGPEGNNRSSKQADGHAAIRSPQGNALAVPPDWLAKGDFAKVCWPLL